MRHWLPTGRREGKEYLALNPRRADTTLGRFSINIVTGQWADFIPGGASGGDLVSLYAFIQGLTQSEAATELAVALGLVAALQPHRKANSKGGVLTPILPVPSDAPACSWRHPKYGAPVAWWHYYNAAGQFLAFVVRVEWRDAEGRTAKDLYPITW